MMLSAIAEDPIPCTQQVAPSPPEETTSTPPSIRAAGVKRRATAAHDDGEEIASSSDDAADRPPPSGVKRRTSADSWRSPPLTDDASPSSDSSSSSSCDRACDATQREMTRQLVAGMDRLHAATSSMSVSLASISASLDVMARRAYAAVPISASSSDGRRVSGEYLAYLESCAVKIGATLSADSVATV